LRRHDEARRLYVEAVGMFDRVAASLTDIELRETFVASAYVRGVHDRLGTAPAT
jgi:hypothetical protein